MAVNSSARAAAARTPGSAPIRVAWPVAPTPVETGFLRLGQFASAARPLEVNSRYLVRDHRPWLPVMGEFHYSRYPEAEWLPELRKMRAGGIDIVASYVFWNHHEEIEGEFDWSARRDLGRFVDLVAQAGMLFFLRPGPWVHGEARHGGFPDWLAARGPLRCNDAAYLGSVARLFDAIGAQLRGRMWCDGGPVVGVQLENEYDQVGPGRGAEHIAELKQLAIAAGLRVPIYTVTGWPTLDIPPREVIPVSGAYADGFWSGAAAELPASGVFLFKTARTIGEMGYVGGTPASAAIDPRHYPFLLAEAGGGMHVSYHRRPVLTTDDVAATALVQIGSGAALYGYYMYHGGTNPLGRPGRFNESQHTGYPNDVPVLGYDFRAPIGQYGQLRPSYGRLRTLHHFLHAFGADLAPMEPVLAAGTPVDPEDRSRPRIAARGAGPGGFIFVNNHVRHHPMPDFAEVRLRVMAGAEVIDLPRNGFDLPSGAYFIWPVGQRIGAAILRYATVQPLTRLNDGAGQTWVAFALPGCVAELCFEPASIRTLDAPDAWRGEDATGLVVRIPPDAAPARLRLVDRAGIEHTLLILDQAQADQCQRVDLHERERLVLCPGSVYRGEDGEEGELVVTAVAEDHARLRIYPADDLPDCVLAADGFGAIDVDAGQRELPPPEVEILQPASGVPALRWGPRIAWREHPVPRAPDDLEYESALRLQLGIGAVVPPAGERIMLIVDYVGDAARLYADDALVDDHFFDGEPWMIGLDRFTRGQHWPRFELRLLGPPQGLTVFLEAAARAQRAATTAAVELRSLRLTHSRSGRLRLRRGTAAAAVE